MSDDAAYGVVAKRKEHSAIKSGKKDLAGNVEGSLGPKAERVDGQRLYLGPGSGGMGGTKRTMAASSSTLNRMSPGSFKIRKRSVK